MNKNISYIVVTLLVCTSLHADSKDIELAGGSKIITTHRIKNILEM